MNRTLDKPWLVAVWPGMGSVALAAGSHLVEHLPAGKLGRIPGHGHFEIERVEVKEGLARAARVPKSTLFGWKNPTGGRDLMVFIGEAQPAKDGYGFCHKLLDRAEDYGVERVATFAAMATPVPPTAPARVFAVANEASVLAELEGLGSAVTLLREGEISGLNGVLLAAASERGLPGFCLLGELPYFAIGVPNPKASLAVLEVFGQLAGVDIDPGPLQRQAEPVERGLMQLWKYMNQSAQRAKGEEGEEPPFTVPSFDATEDEPKDEAALSPGDQHRIELLFQRAEEDRSAAVELKNELDRLGVFKRYEDRFLDLFKRGG